MRVLIEAYGCSLNKGEAEEFTESLLNQGHILTTSEAEADAYVIFTCGVIETTEKHMLKRIGQLAINSEKKLMVCGCLGNINPDAIMGVAPHVLMMPTAEHWRGLEYFGESSQHEIIRQERSSAVGILPIATGCSGSCAYCITRKARGTLHSRPVNEIKQRLERLVTRGNVEIQLCAQDTAIYGEDMGINIGELISQLESVEGDYLMRIGMMNPANAKKYLDSILKAYDSQKVFKFLHIPAQSGSNSVLRDMNRRHGVQDFIDVIDAFRTKFPELALSTDTIIGFPGETDEDFQATLELMERIKPDIINITRFSSRPGTPADSMRNRVPGWVAKERSRVMTELRFKLTSENYKKMTGQIVQALATERHNDGTSFLRTKNYKPIVVDSVIELGKWYEIEIVGTSRVYLRGKTHPKSQD